MIQQAPDAPEKNKNTGWAIVTSIGLSVVFYVVYRILFSFVVAAYATFDPSFSSGLGALILLGPGPSVLAMLSGAVTAKTLFKRANNVGLFYGMSTFMVVMGGLQTIVELGRPDSSWVVVIILLVTIVASIIAVRVVLIDEN